MKRLVLAAAATAALAIGVAAAPVHAEDPAPNAGGSAGITAILNPILALIPGPPGWSERHVCAGSQQLDHYWCFYFPFPT